MVFPTSEFFDVMVNGKEEKRPRARIRQFPETSNLNFYNIFIQNYKGDPPLKIKKLAKMVYDLYPKVCEILFVNRNKLKIITEDLNTANLLLKDKQFIDAYRVSVNFDDVETKGVVGIPFEDDDGSSISEETIFNNCQIKHKPEFGFIPNIEEIKIVEVKRFIKFSKEKQQTPLNRVMLTFTGKALPSHVLIDNIMFPVMSYKEPVLQCFKCFRYKHSTKACNKTQAVCRRCAKHHSVSAGNAPADCNDEPRCVNCRGNHASNDRSCPVFRTLKAKNDEKAAIYQPKAGMFLPVEHFPPLGSRKPKNSTKTVQVNKTETVKTITLSNKDSPPEDSASMKSKTDAENGKINSIETKLPVPTGTTTKIIQFKEPSSLEQNQVFVSQEETPFSSLDTDANASAPKRIRPGSGSEESDDSFTLPYKKNSYGI